MGKLVRDLVPDIIRADGRTPDTRVLDTGEYERALMDKLVEEAVELSAADRESRLEEAADVYEVLQALTVVMGVNLEQVKARADAKRAERGGFEQRLWLESW